jgi:TetR/AcrR family transcriptional regulator
MVRTLTAGRPHGNFDAMTSSSASRKSSRDSRPTRGARRGSAKANSDHGSTHAAATGHPQRRRRSDDPGRQRDPARTRQLILDAAIEEFGRSGFDGARVVRIAERAGVAHQLITYHFGGKRGLFDALSDEWVSASRTLVEGEGSLIDALSSVVVYANEHPEWERALIRDGRGQDHGHLVERLKPFLANALERQDRGEIASDLDAGIVTLVFFAANLAPTALPHLTRAFSKVDPDDPKFVEYYTEQLSRIVKHLGTPAIASH